MAVNAENCSITSIHESWFRPGIRLHLKNNKITELPRRTVLKYLDDGGRFGNESATGFDKEPPSIDLAYNPLVYPPAHVYKEGNTAIQKYLAAYKNSMINADDVTLMLIGNQESGKTSLGKILSGEIDSADYIKREDRTQGKIRGLGAYCTGF